MTQCCPGLGELLSPRLFKALGDPNRVAILVRLAESCGPLSVSQVAECCPLNLSVVSRHLAVLREAGVLESRKVGKHVFYTLRAEPLARLLRAMADCIEACCPPAEENNEESKQ